MSEAFAARSPLFRRMIFNVGARRSGTFWLQRLVTAHPTVGSVPSETHLLSHGIAPLLDRFQHEDPESPEVGRVYIERGKLIAALRAFCDEVFAEFLGEGQTRVAERTPLHVLHLDLVAEVYPDARFVHIIRDGRDVARSIAAQTWGPSDVADAAGEWQRCVAAGRGSRLSADRYLEVRYESLLADPTGEIERLYRWLDLPADDSDLAYPLAESTRLENVDTRGVGGVAFQKWRQTFDARDLAAFNSVAGDLLAELGYPPVAPAEIRRRPSRVASLKGRLSLGKQRE